MAKIYKAVIFDIDGTLIRNNFDAMPSKKVTETINKASKKVHIGVATSRPLFVLEHIIEHLKLSGPSIIGGGTQIREFPSKKILWEKMIDFGEIKKIHIILKKLKCTYVIQDGIRNIDYKEFKDSTKPYQIWVQAVPKMQADEIVKTLSQVSTIVAHKIPSWQPEKIDLIVTHVSATKHHGIFEVAKLLGITTHEIIGVGDGYNDFPLLMACGLKVAMGNAVPDLKAIADYIAPSVEEDGAAHVIEKFILNHLS